ncbi:uncharacterized protein LOC105435176 [Cucumis sativus]|uniref:uncharacterized protein LOC105435176 n=1 Tax=Cucumis sativus TaxID=3659 RepID=UPI0012F4CDA0|nr:uncharacterized protein LOC105435176 [Cucumis sativus]
MGKSESAKECKRHPNHNLLPGICPSCLREKLQQFHQSPNYSDSQSTFSSPSSSSSDFFFSADSSRRHRRHHRRNASEFVTGSMAVDLLADKLKKTGSIRISTDGGTGAGVKGKKNLGFGQGCCSAQKLCILVDLSLYEILFSK